MRRLIAPLVFLVSLSQFADARTQERGAPQAPQQTTQPQRGQRRTTPPAKPTPLTLRQVIEALSSLKNSSRVEDQITKAGGVQFEATPAVVDILKQFGAGPKLISMIPAPPPPRETPAPRMAGPLTVICEPKDCVVAVGEKYAGLTNQNRKTITGLSPGETNVEVFAEGYERVSRRVQLEADQPKEEKFALNRSALIRQQSASASLLKAVRSLGGTDGLQELGNVEGSGMMQWTNSSGKVDEWTLTFTKRIGRDLATTFKTKDGQCTASILLAATKSECKGDLRNGGDKIADQATSLLLSYQPQDVLQTLLRRPLQASNSDDNILESVDTKDSYVMTLGNDGLPVDLVYRIGSDPPIHIQYSNYLNLDKGRYPGKIAIGRLNNAPAWVFTISSVRSRALRGQ